jgi:tetratricopeptide (TPR) repeat protein
MNRFLNYNFPMQFRLRLLLLGILAASLSCIAAAQETQPKQKQPQPQVSDPIPHSDDDQTAPPLGDNESSSKQTQIDISPPKDDAAKHPDSDISDSDVTEMHAWNPHKAQKDIEVGEFYFKRKNYHAAEERYREALLYKPGDAIATYRLAEVLDAQGHTAEAVENYELYLRIPSNAKFAPEAKKALARLEAKTSQSNPQ